MKTIAIRHSYEAAVQRCVDSIGARKSTRKLTKMTENLGWRSLSNAAAASTASATAQISKRVLRVHRYKTLWLNTLCSQQYSDLIFLSNDLI